MSSQTIEQIIMPSPQTSIRSSDYQANPFAVTTTALTPSTRTYTRRVVLPKQEYAKYEGPEYEDVKVAPVKTQFGLREVFTSTPDSRREYVKTRKDYNVQASEYNKQALESIETQKREIAKYNKAVDDWNKKGRFQEQTITEQYFPSTTVYEYPTIKYQQRTTSKLSPEEIRSRLFKPVSPELVGPIKPSIIQNELIVGKFEVYNPISNITSPLKRASFRYQSVIDRLSDSKYIDTGKPFKDTLVGAGSSLAILPLSFLKRSTDIISFLGDVSPKIDTKTGQIIKFKDRERVPQQYRLGEITGLSQQTRGEQFYSSIVRRPEQFVGEIATDTALLYGGQKIISSVLNPKLVRKPQIQFFSREVTVAGKKGVETKFFTPKSGQLTSWGDRQVSSIKLIKGQPTPVKSFKVEGIQYTFPIESTKVVGTTARQTKSSLSIARLTDPIKPFKETLKLQEISQSQMNYISKNFEKIMPDSKLQVYSTPPVKTTIENTAGGFLSKYRKPLEIDITQTLGRQSITIDGKRLTRLIDELNLNSIRTKEVYPGITKVRSSDLARQTTTRMIVVDKSIKIPNSLRQISTTPDYVLSKSKLTYEPIKLMIGSSDDIKFIGAYYQKIKPVTNFFTNPAGTTQATQYLKLPPIRFTEPSLQLYNVALPSPKDIGVIDIETGKFVKTSIDKIYDFDKITKLSTATSSSATIGSQAQKTILRMQPLKFDKSYTDSLTKISQETLNSYEGFSKGTTARQTKQAQQQSLKFEEQIRIIQAPKMKYINIEKLNQSNLTKNIQFLLNIKENIQMKRLKQANTTENLLRQTPALDYSNLLTLRENTSQIIWSDIITKQIQGVSQIQNDALLRFNELINNIKQPKSPSIPTTTLPVIGVPPFKLKLGGDRFESKEREINLEDTWIPEYKSKGRWMPIKVDNRKRNYYSAKELGAYIVDNSSERSFRLRKGKGKADIIRTTRPNNMFKYYKPSKTGNPRLTGAWIEESKYAIDSAGERQGITAKGLIAMERKRQIERLNHFQIKMNKTNQNKLRGNSLVNKLLR